jgi:hypothetical protein
MELVDEIAGRHVRCLTGPSRFALGDGNEDAANHAEIKPRPVPPRHAAYKGEVSTTIPSRGRIDQAATAGNPMMGSSLTGAMLSSVM